LHVQAAREAAAANPQKRKPSDDNDNSKDNSNDDADADDEKAKKRAKKEAKRAKKEAPGEKNSGSDSKPKHNSGEARLFVGKLPLVVEASAVKAMLSDCAKIGGKNSDESATMPAAAAEDACLAVEWITDKTTGAFYGSCFAQMATPAMASRAAAYFAPGGEGASGVGGGGAASSGNKKGKQAKNSAGAGTPASTVTTTAAYTSLVGRKLRVNVALPKEGEEWPPTGGFKHLPRPPVM